MPRRGTGNAHPGARLKELRRDPDTTELRDAMGFADVFLSLAVFVSGVDMEVAVRILRFVRFYGTRDVYLPAGIEVRREAVMRSRIRCRKHGKQDGRSAAATRNSRKHDAS